MEWAEIVKKLYELGPIGIFGAALVALFLEFQKVVSGRIADAKSNAETRVEELKMRDILLGNASTNNANLASSIDKSNEINEQRGAAIAAQTAAIAQLAIRLETISAAISELSATVKRLHARLDERADMAERSRNEAKDEILKVSEKAIERAERIAPRRGG